jgi:hypothetical protein
MEQILKELTNLQQTIADNKTTAAQLEGRKEETLNQLKKEFQVKTIAEAEKKEVSLLSEQNKIEKLIRDDFAELKEKYDW